MPPEAVQDSLAERPAIVIHTTQPGWYRVGQPALVRAGLDPDIDPHHLQLFAQGQSQRLHITGTSDGRFDPHDAIAFYGQGIETPWTNAYPYWLVVGTQAGPSIPRVDAQASGIAPDTLAATVTLRPRHIYAPIIQNGERENFFGPIVSAEPQDLTLWLDHPALFTEGNARLIIALQGFSTGDHQVRVTFNAHPLDALQFAGRQLHLATLNVPHHLCHGANTLVLKATGPSPDVSLIDTVDITYPRIYMAVDDHLTCSVPAGHQVRLHGFTRPDIRVFDITSPNAPIELSGAIAPHGSGFANTVVAPGNGLRHLYALSEAHVQQPQTVRYHPPSNWHDSEHGADMVILTHRDFDHALEPLHTLRRNQGWQVLRIDVQALYDTFSDGLKSPHALKAFLQHAYRHWHPTPRFVLLVGDASFDPRDYLGHGPTDWVPTYWWVPTTSLETASDAWFADFDDDGLTELAIGRLPVRTPSEAASVVAKLNAHAKTVGDAPRHALVLTDRADHFDFPTAVRPLTHTLAATMPLTTLSLGDLPDDQAQTALEAQLNAGPRLLSYLGHGAVDRWAAHGILTPDIVANLRNDPHFPVVLSMTCLTGFFQAPMTESLAEAWVRAPQGGAVAVWASSGLTLARAQVPLQKAVVERLLATPSLTLGEAIQRAQAVTSDPDVRRTWHLFGDPATRFQ